MAQRKSSTPGAGYRNPPTQTKFQPGVSGNRSGRPKGSRNFSTILSDALNQKVTVTDQQGRQKRISKLEAITTQLVNKAAIADLGAIKLLLGLIQLLDQQPETTPLSGSILGESDRQVLEQLRVRLQLLKVGE